MNDYSDIRSHERYHLKNHIPMPMENRAVQFAPFAALTGYDEEIHEAARLTTLWKTCQTMHLPP